ncbi:hypothetical protein E2C01_061624 [Portunus trituberculatus]|uniref:Uncharacterized protein n=1 Tax=Portunus trituberculatus TaxID=210409 RepID=A0A5B7HEX6_PORTR|nr:hypothetical protein [Portunus trituberculatus]
MCPSTEKCSLYSALCRGLFPSKLLSCVFGDTRADCITPAVLLHPIKNSIIRALAIPIQSPLTRARLRDAAPTHTSQAPSRNKAPYSSVLSTLTTRYPLSPLASVCSCVAPTRFTVFTRPCRVPHMYTYLRLCRLYLTSYERSVNLQLRLLSPFNTGTHFYLENLCTFSLSY